jgi:hypothetical protein
MQKKKNIVSAVSAFQAPVPGGKNGGSFLCWRSSPSGDKKLRRESVVRKLSRGFHRFSNAAAHALHLDDVGHALHLDRVAKMLVEECHHINGALHESSQYLKEHSKEILRFMIPGLLLQVGLFVGLLQLDEEHSRALPAVLWLGSWSYWVAVWLNTAQKLRAFDDHFDVLHELKLIMALSAVVVLAEVAVMIFLVEEGFFHGAQLIFLVVTAQENSTTTLYCKFLMYPGSKVAIFMSGYFLAGHPALKIRFPSAKALLAKVHAVGVDTAASDVKNQHREAWGLEEILGDADGYAYFANHLKGEFTSKWWLVAWLI